MLRKKKTITNVNKIGGNIGYSTILDPIGGNPSYSGYTSSSMPVYDGELLNNKGFNDDILDNDLQYFNIINGNKF
jgi:hypothetical protein